MSNIEDFSREDFDLMYDMYEELTALLTSLNNDVPKIKGLYDDFKTTIGKHSDLIAGVTSSVTSEYEAGIEAIQKKADTVLYSIEKQIRKADALTEQCNDVLQRTQSISSQISTAVEFQNRVERRLSAIESKIERLEKQSAASTTSQPAPQPTSNTSPRTSPPSIILNESSIADFFKKNEFEVIDKRPSGGALWVIGNEASLKTYVDYVEKHFNVTGQYHTGVKSTGHRPAWYTQSKK